MAEISSAINAAGGVERTVSTPRLPKNNGTNNTIERSFASVLDGARRSATDGGKNAGHQSERQVPAAGGNDLPGDNAIDRDTAQSDSAATQSDLPVDAKPEQPQLTELIWPQVALAVNQLQAQQSVAAEGESLAVIESGDVPSEQIADLEVVASNSGVLQQPTGALPSLPDELATSTKGVNELRADLQHLDAAGNSLPAAKPDGATTVRGETPPSATVETQLQGQPNGSSALAAPSHERGSETSSTSPVAAAPQNSAIAADLVDAQKPVEQPLTGVSQVPPAPVVESGGGSAGPLAGSQPSYRLHDPLGSESWQTGMGQRLVLMLRDGEHSAELRLTPPELGKISIRITLAKEDVSVAISVNNHQVREAVEQSLPRLKSLFEEAGIGLGNVDISDQNLQDSGRRAFQRSQESEVAAGSGRVEPYRRRSIVSVSSPVESDALLSVYV